jgi:hypothetical protein
MKGEEAREREKVICEVGTATWQSVRERERRQRKAGYGKGVKGKMEKDVQVISSQFLSSPFIRLDSCLS